MKTEATGVPAPSKYRRIFLLAGVVLVAVLVALGAAAGVEAAMIAKSAAAATMEARLQLSEGRSRLSSDPRVKTACLSCFGTPDS